MAAAEYVRIPGSAAVAEVIQHPVFLIYDPEIGRNTIWGDLMRAFR